MKERLNFKENLLVGALLFGLFFGAGNLIFPVLMGQMAGVNGFSATIGFLLTGVGLPLLGVISSALSENESLYEMAKPVSKMYSTFFTCALYLTIGPLFAIPRTATVAFEVGLNPFINQSDLKLGLLIFSIIFFAITLYFSLRPGKILDWVGRYLTPLFLALLSILIIMTLVKPMGIPINFPAQGAYIEKPFFQGLIDGYQTMDALASLAFAIVIISNIERLGIVNPKRKAIETFKSGIVCLIGMSIVYTSLAYMGASSPGSIPYGSNGGEILTMVSNHYFKLGGKMLLAGIVTVACLKTAIGLITSCAQMFSKMFPKALPYNRAAIIFTLTSLIIANFGLNTIIQLSIPVLMFLYPLAITLILISFLVPFIGIQKEIYVWTTLFTFIAAIFDFLYALPKEIKNVEIINNLIEIAKNALPGFYYGFGWVLPASIGFLIGLTLWKLNTRKNYRPTT